MSIKCIHLRCRIIGIFLLSFNSLYLYAQKVTEYFFDADNGIKLYVKKVGVETNSKILFLHGGAGDNHLNFFPHVDALSSTFQLIFYDQTDAGKSFSEHKPAYSIQLEVENLEKLRKQLGIDKLNMIGHSWGSILALSYAKMYPENVNKILLTGSIGTDASYYRLFARNLQLNLKQADYDKIQKLSKEGASRKVIHETVMLPHYFSDVKKISKMTKTEINFDVNQAIAADILKSYDVKPSLQKFTFPVLVVQGQQDLLTIENIKNGFQNLPTCQFKEIENAGHWAFVEQPELFNKIIVSFFQ